MVAWVALVALFVQPLAATAWSKDCRRAAASDASLGSPTPAATSSQTASQATAPGATTETGATTAPACHVGSGTSSHGEPAVEEPAHGAHTEGEHSPDGESNTDDCACCNDACCCLSAPAAAAASRVADLSPTDAISQIPAAATDAFDSEQRPESFARGPPTA